MWTLTMITLLRMCTWELTWQTLRHYLCMILHCQFKARALPHRHLGTARALSSWRLAYLLFSLFYSYSPLSSYSASALRKRETRMAGRDGDAERDTLNADAAEETILSSKSSQAPLLITKPLRDQYFRLIWVQLQTFHIWTTLNIPFINRQWLRLINIILREQSQLSP